MNQPSISLRSRQISTLGWLPLQEPNATREEKRREDRERERARSSHKKNKNEANRASFNRVQADKLEKYKPVIV